MTDLLDEINMDRPTACFISYADFNMGAQQNDATEMWLEALSEIGLPIDQTKSINTRRDKATNGSTRT